LQRKSDTGEASAERKTIYTWQKRKRGNIGTSC